MAPKILAILIAIVSVGCFIPALLAILGKKGVHVARTNNPWRDATKVYKPVIITDGVKAYYQASTALTKAVWACENMEQVSVVQALVLTKKNTEANVFNNWYSDAGTEVQSTDQFTDDEGLSPDEVITE
jgi:hypothetical protein